MHDLEQDSYEATLCSIIATMDLNRIKLFASVVETESFTAAADTLGTSKSVVSRAVQGLEQDLGVRLLQRTTRKLSVTAAGRAYFDSIRGALSRLEEASNIVSGMGQEPRGIVRVTAADIGGLLLPRLVGDFVTRFPKIRIELSLSARVVDLVEEGFDLALRSGHLRSSSLIARRIGNQTSGLYATPEYVRRRGRPSALRELAGHDCIVLRRPEASAGGGATWRLFRANQPESVTVSGPFVVDDLMAFYESVRLGMGIGFLPALFRPLTNGLLRILPKYSSAAIPVSVVWPSRRLEPARVVLFRDFLIAALAKEKWQA
jgi:DNA-binding transcriptional LysR family regulator